MAITQGVNIDAFGFANSKRTQFPMVGDGMFFALPSRMFTRCRRDVERGQWRAATAHGKNPRSADWEAWKTQKKLKKARTKPIENCA